MAGLKLEGLRKSFGANEILKGVDLTLADGEMLVIVGASGCGKSTLLRLVAGLETPTGGRILIDGRDVTDLDPSARDIAMVFQNYALYPHMSVFENMAYGLKIRGLRHAEIRAKVDAASALLGLEALLDRNKIWLERTKGIGLLSAEDALALGQSGPMLRGSGVDWDLRKAEPYLAYDEVDFDVVVGTYGDSFDRYAIRLNEVRESIKILRQCIERMPEGDYRVQDKKVTPPPRARIDESMEALIHHFKIFTEGFKVPEGEAYVAIESPRGELGCYIVSDGTSKPYRMHIRGPSFVNIQSLPHLMHGGLVADGVAIISSVDPILGEVDR